MQIIPSRIFYENLLAYQSGKRRALNEGGTTSSKTYSIIAILCCIAYSSCRPLIISIVSESLPHLKRGCIRDFLNIMGDSFDESKYNKTEHTYLLNKSTLEFFPADKPSKMRGGRRDILFINEANNIHYDSYRELDIRTSAFTFLDWNPTSEFWIHENKMIADLRNAYTHSTYLDVKAILPLFDAYNRMKLEDKIRDIEDNREKDVNWFNVYGLGRVGKIQGLIHSNFSTIPDSEYPDSSKGIHGYGLDFGYSNDPSALIENIVIDDTVFSRQVFYRKGMTNRDIIAAFEKHGIRKRFDEIYADSNEPKSIQEIYDSDYNIKAVAKGADSVEAGIQKINQYKQVWTEESLDAIKEQRNYRYIEDKDGKITNKPVGNFNHAMDGRRYYIWMAISEAASHQARTGRMAI